MATNRGIIFVSTMSSLPWAGSEELWSRAAVDLVRQGVRVSASVHGWSRPHQRILELAQAGIEIWFRPTEYPIWKRLWRKMYAANKLSIVIEVEKLFAARNPALVVFSDGGALPPVDLLEACDCGRLPS
jgi:hypothetical protein